MLPCNSLFTLTEYLNLNISTTWPFCAPGYGPLVLLCTPLSWLLLAMACTQAAMRLFSQPKGSDFHCRCGMHVHATGCTHVVLQLLVYGSMCLGLLRLQYSVICPQDVIITGVNAAADRWLSKAREQQGQNHQLATCDNCGLNLHLQGC